MTTKDPEPENFYQQQIALATGAPRRDLPLIERIMREEVFHSTLDWQSSEEFVKGAKEAQRRLKQDRALYEADQSARRALFAEMRSVQPY